MREEVLREKKERSKSLDAWGWFQLNILRIVTTMVRSGEDMLIIL